MFGRAGDLKKLNDDRNNPLLSNVQRQQADKAHTKIVEQLKDKKLMRMRERLIRATRADDQEAAMKIQLQMRDYLGEEKETGQWNLISMVKWI